MRRRDFVALLGGVAVAGPLAVRAQEPGRIYRLGCLFSSRRSEPYHVAFYQTLQRYGFIEGQNLRVDDGGYGLSVERYAEHARAHAAAGARRCQALSIQPTRNFHKDHHYGAMNLAARLAYSARLPPPPKGLRGKDRLGRLTGSKHARIRHAAVVLGCSTS